MISVKDIDIDNFNKNGYFIIRNLLNEEEISFYVDKLKEQSGILDDDCKKKWFLPNGVTTQKDFWPLIYNSTLVGCIQKLLGEDIYYSIHSDLHVNGGGFIWHRDNAFRNFGKGPDWNENEHAYKVVRVAIYLQRFEDSFSALGVIPGSHKFSSTSNFIRYWFWRIIYIWEYVYRNIILGNDTFEKYTPLQTAVWTKKDKNSFFNKPSPPTWIKTNPGDCIIFDTRLMHSSSKIKSPKYSMFLTYGANNLHTRNHINFYLNTRKDLSYKPISEELSEILRNKGLLFQM